jgi:hypothetical protein
VTPIPEKPSQFEDGAATIEINRLPRLEVRQGCLCDLKLFFGPDGGLVVEKRFFEAPLNADDSTMDATDFTQALKMVQVTSDGSLRYLDFQGELSDADDPSFPKDLPDTIQPLRRKFLLLSPTFCAHSGSIIYISSI